MKNAALQSQRKDILLQLASCSDTVLFFIVSATRLFVLMAMLFSHAVLPKILNAELVFDNGGLLYDNADGQWTFLDFPRNWDGVHYFHIGAHGYSHENVCAFFPLVPFIIKTVTWLNKEILPVSLRVVPVSFQIALLNALLGGASAIFLRYITLLATSRSRTTGGKVAGSGNWLDELLPPPPPRWCQNGKVTGEGTKVRQKRELGAVIFFWIMSPTVVFTVVVYTESIFSFLTFLGIYLLSFPSKKNGRIVKVTAEAGAVLCFTLAGCARSNVILYVGFLLYPIFLQLFFFETYKRRFFQRNGNFTSLRRWPSVLRYVVTLLEAMCIIAPYLCMSYFCFGRFVPLWDAASQKVICGRFWTFYGWIQKRYWDVGFLSSYRWKNLPNVLIAFPIVFFTLRGFFLFYVIPAFSRTMASSPNEKDGSGDENKFMGRKGKKRKSATLLFSSLYCIAEDLVQSSNMVCLLVLLLIGVTVVHINVVNRLVMSSPALYWIWARQIVWDPWGGNTIVMLRFFVVWICIGILFFPNWVPWT